MPKETISRVAGLLEQQPDKLNFPQDLWVKLIYDFATFYNRNPKKSIRNQAVLSMVPLYFGYTASFVNLTRNDNFDHAEQHVEDLLNRFSQLKPYLVSSWDKTTSRNKKRAIKRDRVQIAVGAR